MPNAKKQTVAVLALEASEATRPGDVVRSFDGGIPAGTVLPAGNSLLVDADEYAAPSKRKTLVISVLTKRADAARKQADGMKRLTSRLTVEAMSSDPMDPATATKHAKAQRQVRESLAADAYADAAQKRLEAAI